MEPLLGSDAAGARTDQFLSPGDHRAAVVPGLRHHQRDDQGWPGDRHHDAALPVLQRRFRVLPRRQRVGVCSHPVRTDADSHHRSTPLRRAAGHLLVITSAPQERVMRTQAQATATRRDAWTPLGYAAMALAVIVVGIPMYWMVLAALKTNQEIFTAPPTWIPLKPTLDNFPAAWRQAPFGNFYVNSMIYTVVSRSEERRVGKECR